jgi:hypothetical protein
MENWVPLGEWHAISDHGNIYSFPRPRTRGGILKPNLDKDGYYKVGIRENGRRTWHRVHNLVCRAFHGEPGENEVTDHIDHNTTNNHVSNLRWLDALENSKRQGWNSGGCKLMEHEVLAIFHAKGSYRSLGREYGVHYVTVADIKKRRTWRHLTA